MLTKCIENILLFFINFITAAVAGSRSGQSLQAAGMGNRLFRLFGHRAGLAHPQEPPADPMVTLGDVIPSAREALRQQRSVRQEVRLGTEERLKHIYVTGGTGAGKTTLLMNILEADITAGRGVGFIDYRGEICDRLLARLAARHSPEELAERLLLIDLRSSNHANQKEHYSVGFNPLAQGRDAYSQVMFVMDVLRQQFGASLGVQTEELCRNILLAMALSNERPPLTDIEVYLTSPAARATLLQHVDDSGVQRFFSRFDALPDVQRGQWVSPVMNKITPLLALPSLRRLLGNRQSVSLREFLDGHPDPIVLVCLAADEIFGAANLVGTLLVGAIGASIMRSHRDSAAPFFLFLDEFQNLAGSSDEQFGMMISEARRFKFGLTLSHQSTSQLEPKLRVLIRNVISTHVIMSTGGMDADLLAGEIPSDEPKTVLKQLLLSQRPGEALIVRRGQPTTRIKTHYSADPNTPPQAVQALRLASLHRHGRPIADIESELRIREATYLPIATEKGDKKSANDPSQSSAQAQRTNRVKEPIATDPHQYEVRERDNTKNNIPETYDEIRTHRHKKRDCNE